MMLVGRRPRLRRVSVNSLIPNMLTVMSVCSGLTSIRFSLIGHWEMACALIVLSGVLDGLDGRLARVLKGTTKFGAELDSLSDFLAFGVAPAMLLYTWTLSDAGGIGWFVVLCYSVCCALRLARFNTAAEGAPPPLWATGFFVGVPAPGAAGLAILPVVATFQFDTPILRSPYVIAPYVIVLAALMISRLPTVSFKRVRIKREAALPLLLIVGLGVAALASYPWYTLGAFGIAYAISIPFTVMRFDRLARGNPQTAADGVPETPDLGPADAAPSAVDGDALPAPANPLKPGTYH